MKTYSVVREELAKELPSLTPESLDRFSLVIQKQPEQETIYSSELKALEEKHGRFVEFDLITSDIDQSSESMNTRLPDQAVDDLITPQAILSAESQLKGSIIDMVDPVEVKDMTELVTDGAKFGGVGHEHVLVSQNIVPALIIDRVKAIDNNRKLRITARINEDSRRADNVWSMIKNKVLKAASIEYRTLKDHYREINGKVIRVVDDLILGGFTLTSKARNSACGVTGWFVKALDVESISNLQMEKTQEQKMETKSEAAPVEKAPEVTETPKYDEQIKALEEQIKALAKTVDSQNGLIDAQKKELEQVKALESDKKLIDSIKGSLKEEIKAVLEADQKQLVETDQKKFEDQIKSSIEEIKTAKGAERWSVASKKHSELLAQGLM